MALPSSPPISMRQIYDEFLVPYGTSFKQLYRGGPHVPDTAANAAISTDPNGLRVAQFYGAVRYVPLTASKSGDAEGSTFIFEPAPDTASVTSAPPVVITPSAGSGSYTCQWFHSSGSTAISTPGVNVFSATFGAVVPKGGLLTAVKLCRVADGVGIYDVYVSVGLSYSTDL